MHAACMEECIGPKQNSNTRTRMHACMRPIRQATCSAGALCGELATMLRRATPTCMHAAGAHTQRRPCGHRRRTCGGAGRSGPHLRRRRQVRAGSASSHPSRESSAGACSSSK